jgi:filamentous hemagglutinin
VAAGGGKAFIKVLTAGLPGVPGIIKKLDLPDVPNFSKADFPEVGTKISTQTQQRHLTEGRLSGGGIKDPNVGGELANLADAQTILDAYHSGAAKIVGRTRSGDPIVEFSGVTGINKNQRSGFPNQPTNRFQIKGTKTISIVPVSPTAGGK